MSRSVRMALCSAAALALVTSASRAGDVPALFQSHFAGIDAGTPCYARAYTTAHLEAHPEQRVGKIILDMDKADPDGKAINAENLQLGFGVQLTSSPEWYTGVAICKSMGAEISCFLEGDGGSFNVTAADEGAIKIESGSYGISMEGEKDFLELPGDKGDDKVFTLPHAPRSECDAATADKEKAK